MLFGVGVIIMSLCIAWSLDYYLNVSSSKLITSVWEERERERERERESLFCCYRLLVILLFPFLGVSSSYGCLDRVALFFVTLPGPSILLVFSSLIVYLSVTYKIHTNTHVYKYTAK